MTLVQALQFTVEDLQEKSLEELQELHSILSGSKQKKARLQADLIAGIVSAKKKEAKEKAQTQTEVKAENSVKQTKRKATVKKKVDAQAETQADAQAETQADAQAETQATAKKATKKKAKKVNAEEKAEEKALEEMTREELLAYVKQLQEQKTREVFPQVIEGEKVKFTRVDLGTIQDIQKVLLEKPYQLYLFADERLNELTQFIVLFANDEVIVLLDRNQQRNSTVTIKTEQLKTDHIVFEKEGKFAYRFYIRGAKK